MADGSPQRRGGGGRGAQFLELGVAGRKTGLAIADTGARDEDGMEDMGGFFPSSPAKSLANGAALSDTDEPTTSPVVELTRNTHIEQTVTETSMDVASSSGMDPTEALQLRQRHISLPPRARSPFKMAVPGSPRRGSSIGPISSPLKSSPVRPNRKLDFTAESGKSSHANGSGRGLSSSPMRRPVHKPPVLSAPVEEEYSVVEESVKKPQVKRGLMSKKGQAGGKKAFAFADSDEEEEASADVTVNTTAPGDETVEPERDTIEQEVSQLLESSAQEDIEMPDAETTVGDITEQQDETMADTTMADTTVAEETTVHEEDESDEEVEPQSKKRGKAAAAPKPKPAPKAKAVPATKSPAPKKAPATKKSAAKPAPESEVEEEEDEDDENVEPSPKAKKIPKEPVKAAAKGRRNKAAEPTPEPKEPEQQEEEVEKPAKPVKQPRKTTKAAAKTKTVVEATPEPEAEEEEEEMEDEEEEEEEEVAEPTPKPAKKVSKTAARTTAKGKGKAAVPAPEPETEEQAPEEPAAKPKTTRGRGKAAEPAPAKPKTTRGKKATEEPAAAPPSKAAKTAEANTKKKVTTGKGKKGVEIYDVPDETETDDHSAAPEQPIEEEDEDDEAEQPARKKQATVSASATKPAASPRRPAIKSRSTSGRAPRGEPSSAPTRVEKAAAAKATKAAEKAEKAAAKEAEKAAAAKEAEKTDKAAKETAKTAKAKKAIKPTSSSSEPAAASSSSQRARSASQEPRGKQRIVREPPPTRSPSPANGARRSRRAHIAPLAFWKNEKIVYTLSTPQPSNPPRMPTIAEVIRVESSPDPPRKKRRSAPTAVASKKRDRSGALKNLDPDEAEEAEDDPGALDSWESNPISGAAGVMSGMVKVYNPDASRGDDEDEEPELVEMELGFSKDRIVGVEVANKDFTFVKTHTSEAGGTGCITIPPGGGKRPKNSGAMFLVFFVHAGRATVVVNGNKFRCGKGGQFMVPRGNVYSIHNEFDSYLKLFFSQSVYLPTQEEEEA